MASNSSGAAPPHVLELRVHGINNTAPNVLLDLPEGEIERVAGDSLGSFWRPTAESLRRRHGRSSPRGSVPARVRREAYSWGGMVRSTPDAAGPGGIVIAGLARVGWALLLPFSIANAAAWSWRLPTHGPAAGRSARAGLVRLFGVLLTLLLVATTTSLAVDVVAQQCYAGRSLDCTVLPGPFEALAGWTTGRRMALLSLAPAGLTVGLWLLSAVSRLRYDVADRLLAAQARSAAPDHAPGPRAPLLARPGFWSSRGDTHRLALAHLAAGLGLVSLILTAQDTLDGGGGPAPVLAVLSAALLAASLATAFGTSTLPTEAAAGAGGRWHGILVGLCCAVYAGTLATLVIRGVTIRAVDDVRARLGFTALELAVLALIGLMALIIAASAFFRIPGSPGRQARFEAWHGLAPAVFLTLALGTGLIWSSLVTVGVGDWLNGGAGASALLGPVATASPPPAVTPGPALAVPLIFPWFGGVSLALFLAALLPIGGALLLRRDVSARAGAWLPARALAEPTVETDMPVGSAAELAVLLGPVRERKRGTAARLHLVEPVVAILGGASFLAVLATLVLSTLSLFSPRFLEWAATGGIRSLLDVSMAVWAGVAVLVLVGLALPVGAGGLARPLAIVWDLACFLPRAGHPLGAPCYTERAVPEVSRRLLWWLRQEEAPRARRREVVLAAHSMGAVVSLSALFALSSHPDWDRFRGRVTLLTFGVQLRPYFGRMFPELLGPAALGTTPCLRPRLWAADPWAADAAAPAPAGDAPSPVPVRRWISLWRLTDPLGFPAYSNRLPGNPLDRFADEIDTGGYTGDVDGHGEYYRTGQYRAAFAELAGLIPPVAAGGPPGAPLAPRARG